MSNSNVVSLERKLESVWEYPRPPIIQDDQRHVRVVWDGTTVADTTSSVRVLETSHPPVFYIPPGDVQLDLLRPNDETSFCEYKGRASYWDLEAKERIHSVAWSYANPSSGYTGIKDFLAFYPSKVACYVDEEKVLSQEGGFYGGWITSEITGPFKGGPGTLGW